MEVFTINDDRQSRLKYDSNRSTRDSHSKLQSTPEMMEKPWSTLYSSSNSKSNISSNTNGNMDMPSKYDWQIESFMLCHHILTRGLFDGVGSDIEVLVPAWNKRYHLHRLILDQNPYFSLLLQGNFQESGSNRITLHFDDYHNDSNDCFITMESFQFILEYLYGNKILVFDNQKPLNPIYTMVVTDSNVKQILATSSYFQVDVCSLICVEYILKNLNFNNVVDYLLFVTKWMVQGSDHILDAIYTFLCREAYYMDPTYLVNLPVNWLQKIIESDAFWVPNEFERYQFLKKIIHARSKVYETSSFGSADLDTSSSSCFIVTQLIYYMHMTFEQLEMIQKDLHPLTHQPLVPESVLKQALWCQIQLRSKIEAASEKDTFLNFNIQASSMDENSSVDKIYYPIPTNDTTTHTGESAISFATFSSSTISMINRIETLQEQERHFSDTIKVEQYSIYPPFRFSVEFCDIRSVKYGVRVYSDTVFYAGSNWNIYIQKIRSQKKGVLQLGVYLHRHSIFHNNDQYQKCSFHTENSNVSEEEDNNHLPYNSNATITLSSSSSHNNSHNTKLLNHNRSSTFKSFSRYSDKRRTTKTWFKIYCPSRGPKHVLTLFQSSPDNFQILQSWVKKYISIYMNIEKAHLYSITTKIKLEYVGMEKYNIMR
ncbi:uncharacterized protein BX663DRAFT_501888 [Cokeromyces recurvatus]|uniref:uncharacterized protein n=1 Tax=Cokeromyces recurvatus TaxID=90255 RepID=UPI00221E6813|nr:uncharacterized protein BX663DRAFT_501888 [Cokeromyces recurvatus]KAI7905141.1 hypothetical protein BX663DRAFT_501888 [Cokeromyces recurvatus]